MREVERVLKKELSVKSQAAGIWRQRVSFLINSSRKEQSAQRELDKLNG